MKTLSNKAEDKERERGKRLARKAKEIAAANRAKGIPETENVKAFINALRKATSK